MNDFKYDSVYEKGSQVCCVMFFERNLFVFSFDEFVKMMSVPVLLSCFNAFVCQVPYL